jgi:hypothetical protein
MDGQGLFSDPFKIRKRMFDSPFSDQHKQLHVLLKEKPLIELGKIVFLDVSVLFN